MNKRLEIQNPTERKYHNLGIDRKKLSKWEVSFISKFVNDHGTAWRPLRGLWVEDVLDFITELLAKEKATQLAIIREIIEEKKERNEEEFNLGMTHEEAAENKGYNQALDDILKALK